jgi:hypothetical protein
MTVLSAPPCDAGSVRDTFKWKKKPQPKRQLIGSQASEKPKSFSFAAYLPHRCCLLCKPDPFVIEKRPYILLFPMPAGVAELADAPDSKSGSKFYTCQRPNRTSIVSMQTTNTYNFLFVIVTEMTTLLTHLLCRTVAARILYFKTINFFLLPPVVSYSLSWWENKLSMVVEPSAAAQLLHQENRNLKKLQRSRT